MSLGRIAVPNRRCPVDDKNCRGRVYRVSYLVSNTAKLKFSLSPLPKKANTPKTFFSISEPVASAKGRGHCVWPVCRHIQIGECVGI